MPRWPSPPLRALASQIPVNDNTICAGLSRVHWAGRLQLVTRPAGQQILLDGAHNVGGAEILVAAVKGILSRGATHPGAGYPAR